MSVDFHGRTSEIIDALEAEGFASDAEQLRAALAIRGTVTEILMRIRWHLRRVHRANKASNPRTRLKIFELLRELDVALS